MDRAPRSAGCKELRVAALEPHRVRPIDGATRQVDALLVDRLEPDDQRHRLSRRCYLALDLGHPGARDLEDLTDVACGEAGASEVGGHVASRLGDLDA